MPDTTPVPPAALKGTSRLFERPRYFPRQLITPDDMNLAQDYLRNRIRRHNRLLHGWGVVCGASVTPAKEAWTVTISAGFILGPCGDEISIDHAVRFDIRTRCKPAREDEDCPPSEDPWCNEVVDAPPAEDQPVFVAVRYAEFPARPVRVSSCGCGGSECEYSRWRDGYEICVLDECPASHQKPPELGGPRQGPPPLCECPTDPWVVLARVVAGKNGAVTVENCACRRQVVTHAAEWWTCREGDDG
jgi:hypothetical protein